MRVYFNFDDVFTFSGEKKYFVNDKVKQSYERALHKGLNLVCMIDSRTGCNLVCVRNEIALLKEIFPSLNYIVVCEGTKVGSIKAVEGPNIKECYLLDKSEGEIRYMTESGGVGVYTGYNFDLLFNMIVDSYQDCGKEDKKSEVQISSKEMVNHPSHYGGANNPYEAIKVIEAWHLTEDFNVGTAVRYLCRAGSKVLGDNTSDSARVEDLRKAVWYLQRRISELDPNCNKYSEVLSVIESEMKDCNPEVKSELNKLKEQIFKLGEVVR